MARSTKKPVKKPIKGSSRKRAVGLAKKAAPAGRPKSAPAPTREHDPDKELFAVTATDIERLDDGQFRRFMRDLLRNEVEACTGARFIDNPGDSNDLGQDAETQRPSDNTTADPFVPVGTTVWQYKAEKKSPSEADFVREIGKPRPREVLKARGNYRYVAQQPRENESAKDALLRKVATAKKYSAKQVAFHAQASLAERARRFPALVLLPVFQRPFDHVHEFGWWAQKHAATTFDLPSRQNELERIVAFLRSAPRPTHARIIGPAGVGKTRLVLEALAQAELAASTAYAPNPTGSTFVAFHKWIAQNKARVVLVVDECDEANAVRLRNEAVEHDLPIVLITINKIEDPSITSSSGDLRVHLDPMSEADIVRILEGSTRIDKPSIFAIARITGGFVKLARVVATAIERDQRKAFNGAALVTVDTIREAVRDLPGLSGDALLWLSGIALFSELRVGAGADESDVASLATFLGVDVRKVQTWNRAAITAQVMSDRGDRVFITPALLAILLAGDLVRDRRADLAGWLRTLPRRLQEAFSSQLGQLGYWEEGRALARDLIGSDGPFGDLLSERQPWARSAFLALGTACKNEALTRLEAWIRDDVTAAEQLSEDRDLERLLFRLIWRTEHFARTFRLLLRGLAASSTPERSGLYRVFVGALRVTIANSQAPFPERFDVAARAFRDHGQSPLIRSYILRALANGAGSGGGDGYSHDDVDVDGRVYWHPPTYGDWWECTRSVVGLLVDALSDDDDSVRREAATNLIDHAAEFIRGRAHERLLSAITTILSIDPRVGKLREELDRSIAFDNLHGADGAVRAAIDALPQDLASRIRVLAEGWPLVRDREERGLPTRPDPAPVAAEIMASPDRSNLITLLFEPWARNAGGLLTALAQRHDAVDAWPAILDASRRSAQSWGAALFLAIAHERKIEKLMAVPRALLDSSDLFEIALGAEAITRMEASDDEVLALAQAVASGRAKATDLRYAIMGRWTERRSKESVAQLIRAAATQEGGRTAALAIAHAAESNLGLSDTELVALLVASMFEVQGHDAWTWEQLGEQVAARVPQALGRAMIQQIGTRARNRENRYTQWHDDEVSGVLNTCINAVPDLARDLLGLWDDAPEFVESFGTASLLHLDAQALGDWATDERRQRALAKIVVAAPHPTTEVLLARFGPESPFGVKLQSQLYPRSWSGSLAKLLETRAEETKNWSVDKTKPVAFRAWARAASSWLHDAAEKAKPYDHDFE